MLNPTTMNLPPYPMEELARIRTELRRKNVKVYDFGTGDPQIPTWPPIKEAMQAGVPDVSQYPSIKGTPELQGSIWDYCKRRLGVDSQSGLGILPTNGSKEAVFHIALSVIGRAGGRKTIAYPNPGYPVYKSSIQFAGGNPLSITLNEQDNYLIKPWELPEADQKDLAALWINYPHNPTGAEISREALEKIISWCRDNDVLLLSDDCYADIYQPDGKPPLHIAEVATGGYLSFMSLSKRSGMTGYRSGFILGDSELLTKVAKARANFGVGTPVPIQKAATVAWQDDSHVQQRRQIFSERINLAFQRLNSMGLINSRPQASFYLWCRLPTGLDDVEFCLGLAELGVIASPSQWLSEGVKGYLRFALVPDLEDIAAAMDIIENYLTSKTKES